MLILASSTAELVVLAQTQAGHETDRVAIDNAYAAWVQADNTKDLNRWVSFLAPNALFLPPNHTALRSNEAIRSFYAELFADKRFALECRQEKIEVSASGDIAWSAGSCRSTFTGPKDSVAHDTSKWVKVWKRQPNGEWKCAVNSWSSDLPQSGQ